MESWQGSTSSRTVNNIALAYFVHRANISDATRDLCSAGFRSGQISISAQTGTEVIPLEGPLENAIGGHSIRWRFNRARAHDRRRQGANQIKGLDALPSEAASPTCWTLDLKSALYALAVSAEVIDLLDRDVLQKGMFMLVDAPGRVTEADTILSNNAGYLRTQYLSGLQA